MTNEEAKRILKIAIEDSKEHIRFCFDVKGIEALKMAIKVLEQEPTTEWINGLIAKVLGEVDGGTDDKYIRYADVCDRIEKSIREYCGAKMESEVSE